MSKIKTPEEILQFTLSVDCAKGLLHDTVTNREHNGIKYRMVRDDLALKAIESYHAQFTQPTIEQDGKSAEDVSIDEKNFNVRIKARIDRILRDLDVWSMLLQVSENWSDYTKLRDKIYSAVGAIEPTDLLPNYKSKPSHAPLPNGFTVEDIIEKAYAEGNRMGLAGYSMLSKHAEYGLTQFLNTLKR